MTSLQADGYEEALRYLYEHLPQYSHLGKKALKRNLDNITALCDRLGKPQLQYKTIHVAGTNGKGSTSHMIAAILMKAGYKVGLYTSPHLIDFRERMRINGEPISTQWVVEFLAQHRGMIEEIHPSYFEATVAMAFAAFADEAVDVAVIETGLGGRLDSTNIIAPELCVITNIAFDHKDVLGDTLAKIAEEKAGIFKQEIPVVLGETTEETAPVFFEKSLHTKSTLYHAHNHWELVGNPSAELHNSGKAVHLTTKEIYDYRCDLMGSYQKNNMRTALTAASVLQAAGWNISISDAFAGIADVQKSTGIRGRYEQLNHQPLVLADVAHNPAGIAEVMQQWAHVKAAKKKILLGFMKDKDVAEALQLFPQGAELYCCQASIPRAMDAEVLCQHARALGHQATSVGSVTDAVPMLLSQLAAEEALLIVGSFFVVGEAIPLVEKYYMSLQHH